jgi:hypothetical protein
MSFKMEVLKEALRSLADLLNRETGHWGDARVLVDLGTLTVRSETRVYALIRGADRVSSDIKALALELPATGDLVTVCEIWSLTAFRETSHTLPVLRIVAEDDQMFELVPVPASNFSPPLPSMRDPMASARRMATPPDVKEGGA